MFWTTFWLTESVVTYDIPWGDDNFSICKSINTYNGELHKEGSCNFRQS